MEKIELMPVKEAIELCNANGITIQAIANNIKNAATDGRNCIRIFDTMLPFDVMKEIMAAGYLISQDKGMVGEKVIIISW